MERRRKLARLITLPAPAPGQFGPDHTAIEVIQPAHWSEADPFILLMDDRIDGTPALGPHPHAGFETVTYVVEGELSAEGGPARLSPGDVEWTTAGSGIVHGPDTPPTGKIRVLQLWLTLPKAERWIRPDNQIIRAAEAPVRREGGAELRLYSGRSADVVSSTRNRVPVLFLEARLGPGAEIDQPVPDRHNGFVYVLEGEAAIGDDAQTLNPGQVGWLDRLDAAADGSGTLRLANRSDRPARLLLYAGARQEVPLVWYGPFIGDTREDIVRSFEAYRAGGFVRI